MLSKGGKIRYFCPHCKSENIIKAQGSDARLMTALITNTIINNSGVCHDCSQCFLGHLELKYQLSVKRNVCGKTTR